MIKDNKDGTFSIVRPCVFEKPKPLTEMQIKRKWIGKKTKVGNLQEFTEGVRWAEKMHKIL